ncbi:iron dicitrate transporter FecR [Odoribacteraceae bacterium]|nr:iron dicitrate transporter FecR [Odoribacteraceae bacterium]GKH92778.1 iron dicitrate transporter FecR [Odoribacteraceae bacterium]GKI00400.1 iron dicitrate transporter FecR [Odoribacteraceae bacterium]GKI04927.1 iron dicitrate transporter FecR [Odoribacteraceae bacterium]
MMKKKNIYDDASLIKKSLIKDLSDKEQKELDQLLDDQSLQDVYKELSDRGYLKKQFMEYEKYSSQKAYREFKERRGHSGRIRIVRWVAVVAAMWVLALGVTLWMTFGKKENVAPLPVASKIIPAGEKKATLTLADGTEVHVEEITARVLQEKGMNIEYRNGEIVYHKSEEETTEVVYNKLEVPRGGECMIKLDDGTKVWVNAETKLKYPVVFVGDRREVVLEGEAFFDVAKNEKPFIVKTSFGDVRVLGTAFGISAYASEPESYTTLVRGKVSVEREGIKPVVILPGEQVVTFKDGKMIKQEVDVEEFVGWKDGIYVFKEKSLGEIMKTLERWYNISVDFQDKSLVDLPFTGNLKRYDDINVFFDALTRTGDMKYRVKGNQVILYK